MYISNGFERFPKKDYISKSDHSNDPVGVSVMSRGGKPKLVRSKPKLDLQVQ